MIYKRKLTGQWGTRTKKEKDDQYIQERNRGIVVTVHLVQIAHSKTRGAFKSFPSVGSDRKTQNSQRKQRRVVVFVLFFKQPMKRQNN